MYVLVPIRVVLLLRSGLDEIASAALGQDLENDHHAYVPSALRKLVSSNFAHVLGY